MSINSNSPTFAKIFRSSPPHIFGSETAACRSLISAPCSYSLGSSVLEINSGMIIEPSFGSMIRQKFYLLVAPSGNYQDTIENGESRSPENRAASDGQEMLGQLSIRSKGKELLEAPSCSSLDASNQPSSGLQRVIESRSQLNFR